MRVKEFIILLISGLFLGLLVDLVLIPSWSGVVLITVIAMGMSWHYQNALREKMKSQQQTLQTQIRSSTKDARLKEKQILTILGNIPSPLAMLDKYGTIVLYNQSFNRFISCEEAEELNYRDERIDSEIRLFLKEAYLSESAIVHHVIFNGIDYQCLSVPIQQKDRFSGCLLVFQDITQAMEKERMQKRFIADASHELKTPIAAIKGMIEILNREDFDDSQTEKEFHQQIEKETCRLEAIVQDLLKLSRLSVNQTTLSRVSVNLETLFQEVLDEFVQQAKKKEVKLTYNIGVRGEFMLDEVKMHQALSNLVANALTHSAANEIILGASLVNGSLQLSVKDNGCGIAEEHLPKLFERFYRVDTHRNRETGGSGLGLAIVKSIVLAHHGEIQVASLPNQGTEFLLNLPIE